jgi:GTP-binding protein
MRREGFELAVTPPQVIMKQDPNNPKKFLEPFEEVTIDTDMEYLPMIIERLNARKGILLSAED